MAELKTQQNDADVHDFIRSVAIHNQQQKDSFELLQIMEDLTGFKAKMWGSSIIGFGQYHYKSDKSKQEGDWPLIGFSPRKTAISLYIYSNTQENEALVKELGKVKMGKGCIYVKKLEDINVDVLKKIIRSTINFLKSKYG